MQSVIFCKKCEHFLPISEFGRNRARKNGLAIYCKQCSKVYNNSRHLITHPNRNAPIGKRWCRECGTYQPIRNFYRDKGGNPTGYCKPCCSLRRLKKYIPVADSNQQMNSNAPEGKKWCKYCQQYKPDTEFKFLKEFGYWRTGCDGCYKKRERHRGRCINDRKKYLYLVDGNLTDQDGRRISLNDGPAILGKPYTIDQAELEREVREEAIHRFWKVYGKRPPASEIILTMSRWEAYRIFNGNFSELSESEQLKLTAHTFGLPEPVRIFIYAPYPDQKILGWLLWDEQPLGKAVPPTDAGVVCAANSDTKIPLARLRRKFLFSAPALFMRKQPDNQNLFEFLAKETAGGTLWFDPDYAEGKAK